MLVHDRPGCHRHDGFRSWWVVAQSIMRSLCIVLFPQNFDDDLGFFQGVEVFAVQQFIPEAGIEAFAAAVLPGDPWLDIGRLQLDDKAATLRSRSLHSARLASSASSRNGMVPTT